MNEVHFPSVFNEQVEVTSWHCSNVSDCHLYWCHLTIDMTQRMPSYVRSSHSPWHIPSKSLVTCDTPQLANQRPGSCHVTRSQPIRGECDLVSGWPGASALSGESSIWSLISVDNDIVCQSGIRGLGELPMGDQRFAAKTWFIHSHFKISSTKNMKYFLSPASTLFFTPKYLPVVLSSIYSLPVCILINVGYDLF